MRLLGRIVSREGKEIKMKPWGTFLRLGSTTQKKRQERRRGSKDLSQNILAKTSNGNQESNKVRVIKERSFYRRWTVLSNRKIKEKKQKRGFACSSRVWRPVGRWKVWTRLCR